MSWKRLTLDLDGLNLYSARAIETDLYVLGAEFVWLYETKRGFHIIAVFPDLTNNDIELMRYFLGDDTRRIAIDRIKSRIAPKQVLWTRKGKGGERELRRRIPAR